jgi:hypothetical protein
MTTVNKENHRKLCVAVNLQFQKVVPGQIVLATVRYSGSSEREIARERDRIREERASCFTCKLYTFQHSYRSIFVT